MLSDGLAIVTGASSGIGRAIAERLLADGWQVMGLQRGSAGFEHPHYAEVSVDLVDTAALDAVMAGLGTPQAVVHAAGILRPGPLGTLSMDDADQMWRLHVAAASRLANTLLPRMAAAGQGRFVLIGSRVAAGLAGRSQYAASKAALIALARSWAGEVVGQGVTVNLVSPAATDTPMLADPARAATAPKLPPLGRLIRPDEVAAAVAFFLSDAAAAITGQDLQICGGASLPR